ncbi:hypothetical protein PFICI_03086 [Pestalotiopsis fici W106-1]|uniref:CFEM domain-containing protein n=1 Tax=Pestalotiopsis fici (strain W106-1 / CGMCC3.15140) TaxID=1229662 RepID=W3XII4_PESFW|nr:uncharacterized protein PFICI_03086 [Pestalotiopsis fici W106-1]ETS85061.1 hypothetical protein PFICI_03086 [Pestalotiopsis fici W106-1]
MVRFFPILVALFLGLAAADGLSACSAGCISQVFSDTTKFGCAVNDKVCACGSTPDFWFAIRDCITQACPSDDLDQQLSDAQADSGTQCAQASGVTPTTPVTTPPPPATTAEAPPTTANAEPSTTEAAETATSPVSPATSPVSTASAETVASAATTATTSASAPSNSATSTASSQSAAATTSGTMQSATSSSTKTVPGTAAASSSSATSGAAADTDDSSTDGLSVAAKAGIGAGAGAAVILAIIVACVVMARKRKNKSNPSRIPTMQISKPLPGSGRQYAGDIEAARMAALSTQFRDDQLTPIKTAAYKPSITSSSQYSPTSLYAPSDYDERQVAGRRYEDMLPRTQPRTMI